MKHILTFNESILNISKEDYKKLTDNISSYKYYVGYIKKSEGIRSWMHYGRYKGFLTKDEALSFVDELKERGIKSIRILTPNEYNKIEKQRNKGE